MEEEKESEAAAMIDFREIDHPTEFLYQHEKTGEIFRLDGFDGDIPILQPVNLIIRESAPLLQAPQPVLQLPQYVQSRPRPAPVNGYYSGIIEGEILSEEEIVQDSPIVVEAIKRLPIEGKLLLLPAVIILLFFGLAVPMVPKVVKTIQQASAPAPIISSGKVTDRLQRISQLDAGQYDAEQYDAYSQSACSAASLTEAFNAYGGQYRISVVLGSEINAGVITPDLGLIDNSAIAKTANRFGFDTQSVSGLDQAISAANTGTPVVVDLLPGLAWPHGHFLDIVGGDDSSVRLADSWSTDFKQVDRARFLRWNPGQMWAISPSRYSLLQGHPTLSADQVNAFLATKHSPMAGQGQVFVDMSNTYHIDDAYMLATFHHESQDGTQGEAIHSLSVGNLRCADWITWGWCQDGYEWFHSWPDGLKALSILLAGSHYSGAGNNTPETCVPLFAPSGDNNDEAGYISALKSGIESLRAGKTQF